MGKKKNIQRKPEQGKSVTGKKSDNRKVIRLKETQAMVNWVLVLLTIFPFAFTTKNIDPVLALRYTLIGAFVTLFLLYFFLIRKRLVNQSLPFIVRLIFILGIGYGLWNFLSFTQAVNQQQVYFGLARHFLNMILLFIFTNMAEQEENKVVNIFKLLGLAAIVHTIIGLGQFYNTAFTELPGNFRPYGLMANRNLYGSGQVLLLPFCIYVLYKSSWFWKAVAGLGIFGIVLSSIMSQTRSSWLEGATILLVSLLLVVIFSRENRKKWLIGTASALAAIFLAALFLISTDTEGDFSQSIKQRTSEVFASNSKDSSAATENVSERIKIWKKTLQVIKDKPITGVGLENWKLVVPKYGTEGLLWEKGFYIPDSTHNDYLLIVAESGIPGALLYFGMWFVILFAGFKVISKTKSPDRKILAILMISGIAGFSIDGMFSFPLSRMEHSLYLFLMGGIITGLYIKDTELEKRRIKFSLPIIVAVLLIGSFNFFLGLKKMSFEKHMGYSKFLEEQKNYAQSIIEGKKAQNDWVNIPPNGFPVEAYIGLSQKSLKNYPETFKEMNASLKISPYNKALYVNMGTVYTDLKKYDTAILWFKKALALTPKMDIIFYNLAANYFQIKDYKKCLEMLANADISKEPNLQYIKQQAEALLAQQDTLKPPVK